MQAETQLFAVPGHTTDARVAQLVRIPLIDSVFWNVRNRGKWILEKSGRILGSLSLIECASG
jgi:hypothetical protein